MGFFWFKKNSNNFNATAELQQESPNISLKVMGEIPSWLSGTLIRNGPIKVMVNGKSNVHWFDGLACLYSSLTNFSMFFVDSLN